MASFDIRDFNVYASRAMIVILLFAALAMPVMIAFGGVFTGSTARAEADQAMRAAAAERKTVDVQIVGPDETDVIIDPNAKPTLRPAPEASASPSPAASASPAR